MFFCDNELFVVLFGPVSRWALTVIIGSLEQSTVATHCSNSVFWGAEGAPKAVKTAFFVGSDRQNPLYLACVLSSVVEHYLHTVGVAGSKPAARTIFFRYTPVNAARRRVNRPLNVQRPANNPLFLMG